MSMGADEHSVNKMIEAHLQTLEGITTDCWWCRQAGADSRAAPPRSSPARDSRDICVGTADSPLFRVSGSHVGVFCDVCVRVLQSDALVRVVDGVESVLTETSTMVGTTAGIPMRTPHVW